MKKYKWVIILANLIILLVYFNYSVSKKEEILQDGKLVLLQLAPVDPRSLMQGDYMTLRYSISQNISSNHLPKRGYCVVRLDSRGVAEKVRFQQEAAPLNKDEYLIKYTSPNEWNINIGAESFFFQEGQAEKYSRAKYGGVKIDKNGNSLLTGLYDERLKNIK
ncbi:GDYXXLXY domain-containing protein [Chryseobacterium sp.]|uniref:GDYXXLXY domain-containing protein n=1 Tax=Chryseobacterium sp. TaxID=1871047 RepID=UPI002630C836|nr:GDYXXLXY domain-containing protein [Chryseobacterium sp.]